MGDAIVVGGCRARRPRRKFEPALRGVHETAALVVAVAVERDLHGAERVVGVEVDALADGRAATELDLAAFSHDREARRESCNNVGADELGKAVRRRQRDLEVAGSVGAPLVEVPHERRAARPPRR